jgi:signal transduction histidine kinase
MGLRHRSIRLRVGVLIIVPVLCLIGLYAFAVSITLGNALNASHAKTLRDALLTPLGNFQQKLDNEQRLAVLSLATPGSADLASKLSQAENDTRLALGSLTQTFSSPSVTSAAQPHELQAIKALLADTQKLSYIRNVVDASAITIPRAIQAYGTITNQGYQVLAAAMFQQSDVPLVTQAMQVINLDQVAQTTLEESDLITADIARAKFPTEDRVLFGQLAGNRSQLVAATLPLLDPQYRQMVTSNVPAATSKQLTSLEATIEATPWRSGPPPPAIQGGLGVFGNYSAAIGKASGQAATTLQNQAQSRADSVFAELILAAGFGLLGTIASVALSLFIGRRLVRQLRGLRESALGLANDRLPAVIRQLRDGQAVDLADYEVPVREGTKDEIEQVQHAFNVVQQTAVKSAIDEARLRRGISDVFRNLAGRSQSLLHRQLTLLDGMERRATEPEELEDLFRIDHLTTRMRRHAEGLIILSGETPARGWRQPVPLIDVLRAAVAEVEDYTRIRVLARTRSAVAGHAVADVIHLVAELAENATVFSPPNTPVRIQGDIVGKGFAIEIEDRGLGISPDRLAEINRDLADPPQFDLSDSDRLGLFIAGQLARRHDISITLQPSVYGGTTAIVLIPMSLVVDEGTYAPDPALPAGRHAALSGAERGRLTAGNGHPLSLVQDAAASLPSGTLASAEAVAAADEAFSPAAFVDPGTFGPVGSFPPTGVPAAPPLPSPSALPSPPPGPAPASQPPASLPGRGHRIGERAWQPPVPAETGPAETGPAETGPAETGPAETGPPETGPAETGAAETGPAETGPAETGPAETWPAETWPAETTPASPVRASAEPAYPVPASRDPAPAADAPSPAGTVPAGLADDDGTPARPAADGAITDVFARRAGADDSTTPPAGSGSAQPGRDRGEGRISTEELAELGLPVRVRQASLAPQLRDSRAAPVPPPAPAAEPESGSPEAARSTMSALQRGWQLGRAQAGGWPAATDMPGDSADPADDEPPPTPDGTDERAAD